MRRLLGGKIEVPEISSFVHFQCRLRGAFRPVRYSLSKIDKLLVPLMLVKRGAHFSCYAENLMTNAQLGCFKLCRRDSLP